MHFNQTWTQFALDAEVDHYGTKRIADAHNALRARIAELEAEREALRAENERLTLDTTWQDHADHWQKRAMEAEARVAELQSEKDELHELLEEVLPTAESYLYICPDRHGKTIALFARARQAIAGKEGE